LVPQLAQYKVLLVLFDCHKFGTHLDELGVAILKNLQRREKRKNISRFRHWKRKCSKSSSQQAGAKQRLTGIFITLADSFARSSALAFIYSSIPEFRGEWKAWRGIRWVS
jgi:hypothetical protein